MGLTRRELLTAATATAIVNEAVPLRSATAGFNPNGRDPTSLLYVNVKDDPFNAHGNGSTDDTAAIQGAIDFALQNFITTVILPDGKYKTSDTLHLGYGYTYAGHNFSTICLKGISKPGSDIGTRIKPTFIDRPVINIQGARGSGVENLHIIGPVQVPDPVPNSPLSRANVDNFIPPGCATDSWAPYCGVAIDGYGGSEPLSPHVPYPTTKVLPGFLGGGIMSYGRNLSSNMYVRNCKFTSTFIGIMLQSNTDGNGDFLDASYCQFSNLRCSFAAHNVNARSNILSNTNHYGVYCCFDGVNFGRYNAGNLGGNYENIHVNNIYKVFEYDPGRCRPFTVSTLYGENMMKLGEWYTGLGTTWPTFIGCSFQFLPHSWYQGALYEAYVDNHYADSAHFIGCNFRGMACAHFFNDCTFESCTFDTNQGSQIFGAPAMDPVLEAAVKPFRGVFCLPGRQSGQTMSWGEQFGSDLAEPRFRHCFGSRYYSGYDDDYGGGISSWWSHGCCGDSAAGEGHASIPYVVPNWQRHKYLGAALTNRVLTDNGFTTEQVDGMFDLSDVILVGGRGSWLYCSAIENLSGGNSIYTFTLLNNYRYYGSSSPPGGYELYDDLSNTRLKIHYFPVKAMSFELNTRKYWSTTAGSPVAECVAATGATIPIPSGLAAGDKLFWFGSGALSPLARFLPFPAENKILSTGTNNVTMTTNAQVTGIYAHAPGISRNLLYI